jgi:hypothetical protein
MIIKYLTDSKLNEKIEIVVVGAVFFILNPLSVSPKGEKKTHSFPLGGSPYSYREGRG